MILQFAESLSGLGRLVTAITYLLGVFFLVKGLYKFRMMGDHRSAMHQPMDVTGPLMTLIIGTMLIWWPTLIDVTTYTFWGTTSPLSYQPSYGYEIDTLIETSFQVIRLIGIIAFIKGWYLVVKSGEQGGQGMLGKGMTHIVGGILAYHMGATVRVLMNTFGFNV